jgi:hypothetical protein
MIQERGFQNIGFLESVFLWILDTGFVGRLVFQDFVFGFSWMFGSGFCLDIGVLVNRSI